MSAHTPGPWVANRVDPQEWHIDAPNGDPNLGSARWHAFVIVYGCDDMRSKGEEVVAANARLIAAAPELLEALEAINNCISWSDTVQRWILNGPATARPALEKVRAAIAKAKGETT